MLTVVIPAFREQDRLPATLASVVDFRRRGWEKIIDDVVVVDDGSRDATSERAMYFVDKLPLNLVRLSVNCGKWAAIHEGLKVAKNDAVLILDADGASDVSELERMGPLFWKSVKEKTAVFGTRFDKSSVVQGKSWLRLVVSRGYRVFSRFCYWYATGRRDVDDMQCPFKLVYRSKLLEGYSLRVDRFAGDIELACAVGGGILNWPILFHHKAGSTVKPATVWEMFVDTIGVARDMKKHLDASE